MKYVGRPENYLTDKQHIHRKKKKKSSKGYFSFMNFSLITISSNEMIPFMIKFNKSFDKAHVHLFKGTKYLISDKSSRTTFQL